MRFKKSFRVITVEGQSFDKSISLETTFMEKNESVIQFNLIDKPTIVIGNTYRTTRLNIKKVIEDSIDLRRLD